MPRVAIFLCDENTMTVCLQHKMFGTKAPYGLGVRQGDFLLLYNFGQNKIYGAWRAASDGGNYDRNLWNGRYPNQVHIEQTSQEIVCYPRYQIQALVGFDIIGNIYDGVRALNLLQSFQPTVARQEVQQSRREPSQPNSSRQPEPDYLLLPPKFFCEDSDRVRSQGEKIIDDCLYHFGVRHNYEPQITIQGGQLIPDFVVFSRSGKQVYIEYWGKLNEQNYDNRRREKTRLYRDNNLSLIQITPDDLRVIEFVLGKELEKWNVPFEKSKRRGFDLIIYFLRRVFNAFRKH